MGQIERTIKQAKKLANSEVPEHRDATEEYIYVLSGHGSITIDSKTSALGPGSAVYMPANAKVSFANGSETMTAVQVFAGPSPAQKYDSWAGVSRGH